MDINSVVQVNITRDTKVPTQKGFGVPAILSSEAGELNNLGLVTEFNSDSALVEMIAAGFTTSDETYKAVVSMTSQNPKPEKIKIIKQGDAVAQVSTVSVGTLANNTAYTVTLDGVPHTITSDADATVAEILAALASLIGPLDDYAAVVSGSTLVITASTPGQGFSLEKSSNLTVVATTPNQGPVEDLIAARELDDDWYYLTTTSANKSQILSIARYIETEIKLFAYQTHDADVIDDALNDDDTSIMKKLSDLNLDRSFGVYTPAEKHLEFKQAGWISRQATREPGSTNWKFKSIKAASSDKITAAKLKNIQDKKGNVYVTIGGMDMFQEGVVASGEFIDIMVGTDFIQARIMETVFGLFTSSEKVPFDDGGIESVGLQVEMVLNDAVNRSILISNANLDDDGIGMGPKVTVPRRSETTKADRAARVLKGISFTGNYAGAINKAIINGTLTV